MEVIIRSGLVIPERELIWSFSRSSGPGGQAVNTADSRVSLTWDLQASSLLGPILKERALQRLGSGTITVVAQRHRSQLRNRHEAAERLADQVRRAIAPPRRSRRATQPSAAAKARRLETKRHRGRIKADRRRDGEE